MKEGVHNWFSSAFGAEIVGSGGGIGTGCSRGSMVDE